MIRLRRQQIAILRICNEILHGSPIRKIIVDVTPGGGKSALPVLLARELIPAVADKLLWICPRDALKYQGEEEFLSPIWQTSKRLRATHGNEAHPDRGADGYITTFQGVATSPEEHLEYVRRHKTIVFLDEAHHLSDDLSWAEAMRPIIDAATLLVVASGTLARGDGQPIAFIDYDDAGMPVLEEDQTTRVVTYSRGDALADGAILPVYSRFIDGSAHWRSAEGIERSIPSLEHSGSDRSAALFTVLRTNYAYQILDACLADWQIHKNTFQWAKCIIVATNIEVAKKYHEHVARHWLSEIATSDDTSRARKIIKEFKVGAIDILITVGMAYEGLSVPQITHIACLTHIRSVPWLEQLVARGNRLFLDKQCAVIWGPADKAFKDAIRTIELQQRKALEEKQEASGPKRDIELVDSIGPPSITPLGSAAIDVPEFDFNPRPVEISISEAERILKDNIRAIKRDLLSRKGVGARRTYKNVLNLKIRAVVNKTLDEMTSDELTRVWEMLRGLYGFT